MNERTITDARNEPEEMGRRESGTRGRLLKVEWTDVEWTKSEWFDDWLKLANHQKSSQ